MLTVLLLHASQQIMPPVDGIWRWLQQQTIFLIMLQVLLQAFATLYFIVASILFYFTCAHGLKAILFCCR